MRENVSFRDAFVYHGYFDGLRGYLECLPGAKEMGVIYGAGAWQLGDIQENPAMQEAYRMGKSI